MEKYYNLHHLVTFKIAFNPRLWGGIFSGWDIELQGFESHKVESPDFTISIGKFIPNNQDCYILDDKYYVKDNYLYCQDSYKYAKWEVEMCGFEQGKMMIRIHPNFLGKMLIPELIINHLIWFKLNEKGYPIVHGSGVSKDGRAYIFAAQGAAGKSTIALSLVEKGFKLLSDHFVILNQGDVLSFPAPLHIMDFNISPIVKSSMNSSHKVSFYFKQLFHRLTGKRIATKILPRDILPSLLVDRAKLHSIFLLLPKGSFMVTRIGKEELISHLMMNQKLESFLFIKYMMEYSYLFPKSKMATYWTRYQENLGTALASEIAMYKVEVPLKYDNNTVDGVFRLLRDEREC